MCSFNICKKVDKNLLTYWIRQKGLYYRIGQLVEVLNKVLNVVSFITDTLNIIKDYVNNDDQFTRKTVIHQDKFLDLINLV